MNLLVLILQELHIPYTMDYARIIGKLYIPNKNLFELGEALKVYGVLSCGVRLSKKENIVGYCAPFVAEFNNQFVVVQNIEKDIVVYKSSCRRGKKKVGLNVFLEGCSSILFLLEKTDSAKEPDYRKHLIEEFVRIGVVSLLSLCFLIFFICNYNAFEESFFSKSGLLFLVVLHLIGLGASFVLLDISMNQRSFGKKICSILGNENCASLITSKKYEVFSISWSEVGVAYFASTLFLLAFFPEVIPVMSIICFLSLFFSLWSIGIQIKERMFCVLCSCCMAVFWLSEFCYVWYVKPDIFAYARNISVRTLSLFLICSLSAFLLVRFYVVLQKKLQFALTMSARYLILKRNKLVFKSLLEQNPSFSEVDSTIVFGNENGVNKLTIISNPYCHPCAVAYYDLIDLLDQRKDDLMVQYVFVPFEEKQIGACLYLIYLYQNAQIKDLRQVYGDWYQNGRVRNVPKRLYGKKVHDEYIKHESFIRNYAVRETPTIILNGYLFPEEYEIADLNYLI